MIACITFFVIVFPACLNVCVSLHTLSHDLSNPCNHSASWGNKNRFNFVTQYRSQRVLRHGQSPISPQRVLYMDTPKSRIWKWLSISIFFSEKSCFILFKARILFFVGCLGFILPRSRKSSSFGVVWSASGNVKSERFVPTIYSLRRLWGTPKSLEFSIFQWIV